MMRFAILGEAPAARPLIDAIAAHPQHQVSVVVASPAFWQELLPAHPSARLGRSWDELLAESPVDAAILASDDPELTTAARQLAEAGVALAVLPGGALAAALAYELTLLRADRPVVLFPLFSARGNPLVAAFRSLLQSQRLGQIQHVQLQRHEQATEGRLPVERLARALAADIDLARVLFGEFDQVTAIRSGDSTVGVSLATVTLGGADAPQIVWSATAAVGQPRWQLSVVGTQGTATLTGDPAAGRVVLETSSGTVQPDDFEPGPGLLEAFERVVRSAGSNAASAEPGEQTDEIAPADWHDLTRGVDLLEAIERSVRRRRTIDVYFDLPSERSMFKTQMTAAGCSLLMVTLVFVIVYLGLAAVVDLPAAVKRVLVVLIFAPLGLFLAFQALLFLTRPAERRASSSGGGLPLTGQKQAVGQKQPDD